MPIRDYDIRKYMLDELNKNKHIGMLVKPEMQIGYGTAVIDIAVIDDTFYGYEIKSEVDTLQRLKNQIETYDKLINKTTLLTCEKHYKKAMELIPDYWGVSIFTNDISGLIMTKIREPLSNPNRETFALAQLLWKSELIDLLTKINAIKGLKYKPKFKLWREVSSRMEFEQLEPIVINYLRQRDNWKTL